MAHRGLPLRAIALLPVLLLIGIPATSTLPTGSAGFSDRAHPLAPSNSGALVANATWNGKDVATASTIASAISSNLGSSIALHYAWHSKILPGPAGPVPYNLSTARLEMIYFGFPLDTRDALLQNPVAATSGSFNLSWSPGYLQWLLAGLYEFKASLLAPNGSTMWTEQFYVRAVVPGGVGAVLPILLIAILLGEVTVLATLGRQARGLQGKGLRPWTPPAKEGEPPPSGSEAQPPPETPAPQDSP